MFWGHLGPSQSAGHLEKKYIRHRVKGYLATPLMLQRQTSRPRVWGFIQDHELMNGRRGLGPEQELEVRKKRSGMRVGREGSGKWDQEDWPGAGAAALWGLRPGLAGSERYTAVPRSLSPWYTWHFQGWERSLASCISSQGPKEPLQDCLSGGLHTKRSRPEAGVTSQSSFLSLPDNPKDLGVTEKIRGKRSLGARPPYLKP